MKINLDSVFNLEPEQAVGFFADKGLKPSFDWRDMVGQEHDTAFTVAKMMDNDLLETTQGLLKQAIKDGQSFGAFKEQLIPKLVEKGWWGRAEMLDPLTGMVSEVQLGSVSRLETVFRTNMQSAYGAGKWESIERNAKTAPYLMYVAVDDGRTREEHARFDGLVLPWDHPFWKTHYPPNGWNCRCGVIQLSAAEVKEMGLKVSKNPPPIKQSKWINPRTGKTHKVLEGLDPGWNHNPGVERVKALKQVYEEKINALPAELKKAAVKGDQAMLKAKRSNHLSSKIQGMKSSAKIIPNQTTWKSYPGLVDVRKEKSLLPSPIQLPKSNTREQALLAFKSALGFVANIVAIKSPIGDVTFSEEKLFHFVEKVDAARERFSHYVLETIKHPYEVWFSSYDDASQRNIFIGLYDGEHDFLVTTWVDATGNLFWNAMPISKGKNYLNNQRVGKLVFQRKG